MSEEQQKELGKILWDIANELRGAMNADDFRDYMLSFLFLRYLSDNYIESVKRELGSDYPKLERGDNRIPLAVWYENNSEDIEFFEDMMRKKVHYVIKPEYLWESIAELARKHDEELLKTLEDAFKYIENESFATAFDGLFSEINLNSDKLGKDYKKRNEKLCNIIGKIADGIAKFSNDSDILGDAYEYLISHFASDAGKKGGEFFTPSSVSTLLAKLVEAKEGDRIYDPTCGSGSLLIKASKEVGNENFAIYGQEKNGQTQALCKMNMFLHEINDANIAWGDTLRNPLHIENDHLMKFDVVVANPPFSLDKWGADELKDDKYGRFKYGLPPKSKGDYAFVQHMLASLNAEGRMGVVLPHGVLFRGASEGKIRKGIIDDNLLDAVIGLPANLFFGTGIPATILIFKKGRKNSDVLFIDASREFNKDKNQNSIDDKHIAKILDTYKNRKEIEKYSHIATLEEIQENDYNLNIPRYVDTFEEEEPVDIKATKQEIAKIEEELKEVKQQMQKYLEELGL